MKSSMSSAKFMATRATGQPNSAGAAYIRFRSAAAGRLRAPTNHAAPTELGWPSGVLVTIDIALLTELDRRALSLAPAVSSPISGASSHSLNPCCRILAIQALAKYILMMFGVLLCDDWN